MERGLIRKYIAERGFGFIVPALSPTVRMYFSTFHVIVGDYMPAEGDPVEYESTFDATGRAKATG